jgi:hypothetical protein
VSRHPRTFALVAAFQSRQRESPGATVAPADTEVTVACDGGLPLRRDHVLALQRSAGNVVVCGSLRRAHLGLIQRDRKLPDDPHSLSDVSAAAKDITIDKDTVSIPGRAWYFKNPRLSARPGFWVETRFGSKMAATPDDEKEKALRAGLGSVGMIMFGLNADPPKDPKSKDEQMPGAEARGPRRPPSTDLTRIEEMDLTAFGGQDGRYRFTAVVRASAQKTEVDLIVEFLGARRPAFKDWDQLGPKRQKDLEGLFKRLGYKRAQDEPDAVVDKWSPDQWGRVLQALESVPEDMLRGVTGIVWERGHSPAGATKESGHYDTKTGLKKGDSPDRRLQIYDVAFKSDAALIEVVAHEIGHAISTKPTETGGTAIADVAADYQKAAQADGPHAITKYGDTNWSEHYAEAYAMFITEPATLKLLRPNVFAWFEKQRAAAAPPKPPAATKPAPAGTKR